METNFGGCGLSDFRVMAPFLDFKAAKISLRAMGYSPWGSKNRIGSKNLCKWRSTWNAWKTILVGVTSLISELWLSLACIQKRQKFPFGPWAIVHGGQKIELAQKIHVSRGQLEMHGKQFWWAWPLRFRSYRSFYLCSKTAKISLWTMGYSPWGSKNRIGSKNSCK